MPFFLSKQVNLVNMKNISSGLLILCATLLSFSLDSNAQPSITPALIPRHIASKDFAEFLLEAGSL
jgi:hypothetical protein